MYNAGGILPVLQALILLPLSMFEKNKNPVSYIIQVANLLLK